MPSKRSTSTRRCPPPTTGQVSTSEVTRIVEESTAIRSFYLEPDDGAGLLPHLAGQHLPIRVTLPGADNRHIAGVPHVAMAFHPKVMTDTLKLL